MANLLSTTVNGNLITSGGYTTSNYTRILYPSGGSYVTTTSVITGAIRIKLPTQGSAMMMTCTVKVYEYSVNKSFTITFGGHRDSNNWYNVFCYLDGDSARGNLTVRFGVDDGKDCVWIGDTSNQWGYPQVFVTDVQLGYTGYNQTWASGWSVDFVTSFATINRTETAYAKITNANIGSQSVNYANTAGSAPNGSNVNSFYNVTAGDGNGLRFWGGSDSYKISMGVGSLYEYGTVDDYSIKMQMNDSSTGRGFTWGRLSYAPIASLNSTSGDFQVAGTISNGSIWINNGANYNSYNENIRLFNAPNGVSVIGFSASGTSGTPTTSILGFSDRLETRVGDTWEQRIYSGYVEARGSFRAPIFYDSDDTTFYGDFNSRSVLNSLQLGTAASDNSNLKLDVQGNMAIRGANGLYFGVSTNSINSWTTKIYASGSTQYFNAQQFIFDNQGYVSQPQTFASFSSQEALFRTYPADLNYKISVTGGDQFNAYYGSGAATLYLQYHSGNGGALNVANGKLTVNTAGSVVASGDLRAPIFYDSNDTSYYLDPNSYSKLWRTSTHIAPSPGVGSSNWVTDFENTPVTSMSFGGDLSSGGPRGNWWFQQNFRHGNSSSTWGTQIAWGWEDNSKELWQRNVSAGSYSNWTRYLNTDNHQSVLPSYYMSIPAWTSGTQSAVRGSFVASGRWYRIANLGTERFFARVRIYDNSSGGPHSSVEFQVSGAFNNLAGYSFVQTSNGYYSAASVTQVRILYAGTYDQQYLEVYINYVGDSGSAFAVSLLEARNATVVNWTDGEIPSGYSRIVWDASGPLAVAGRAAVFNDGIRSATIYDIDDSAYYLNPNGTSVLKGFDLNTTGTAKFRYLVPGEGTVSINAPFAFNSAYGAINIAMTDNDTGGVVIDNEGVTVYGAGDTGAVFRVIDEDVWQTNGNNVDAATTFSVIQGADGGALTRGTHTATNDFRAPIFYDYNDTTYYADFASTGTAIQARGLIRTWGGNSGSGAGWDTAIEIGETSAGTVNGNFPTYITGYGVNIRKSSDGCFLGLVTYDGGSNYHSVIGWGDDSGEQLQFRFNNAVVATMDYAGNYTANSSLRAPIFYDSQDTSYYVDPNSASQFSSVYANNWFRPQGGTGLYFQTFGYGIYSADSGGSSYGNVATYSEGVNSWPGYAIKNYACFMARDIRRGIFIPTQDSWLIRWESSDNMAHVDFELQWGSDIRHKSNIKRLTNSLEKVKQLKGVSYNYKGNERTSIGFIAQEVEPILPEVVSTDADGFKSVGYANIVALLSEAIKEQQAIIEELKARIDVLESK